MNFHMHHQNHRLLWDAINDLPLLETSNDVCTSYACNPSNTFQKLMRANSKILNNNEITHHTQKTKNIIKLVPEGNNYKCLPKHLKNTRKVHIAWTRLDGNKPSSTIDTGHRHHFHPKADRVPKYVNPQEYNHFQIISNLLVPKHLNIDRFGMLYHHFLHTQLL